MFPERVIWSWKELKSLRNLQGRNIKAISPDQSGFIKRIGTVTSEADAEQRVSAYYDDRAKRQGPSGR